MYIRQIKYLLQDREDCSPENTWFTTCNKSSGRFPQFVASSEAAGDCRKGFIPLAAEATFTQGALSGCCTSCSSHTWESMCTPHKGREREPLEPEAQCRLAVSTARPALSSKLQILYCTQCGRPHGHRRSSSPS